MALEKLSEQYISTENDFYRDHFHHFFYGLMGVMAAVIVAVSVLLLQILHRPLPPFYAEMQNKQTMTLTPFQEPNLLPGTLTSFASKAATLAYNFNFVNYEQSISLARPYFTEAGWADFRRAIQPTVSQIVAAQLFVYGVVTGMPVITNQGSLPDKGYSWRIQIPFLVSYTSSETTSLEQHVVIITIVKVPTSVNPQGIGIDQFIMR